jgi:hypothetical protein
MSMSCTAADASPATGDYLIVGQKMEGQNLIHLLKGTSYAKSVTLSFWIKSNKTGTAIAEFFDNNNSRHINKSFTIDTANTWEKKEITYEGDTVDAFTNNNAQGARIQLWFGAGSNYTTGTLQTSWGEQDQTGRAVGVSNWADSTSNVIYLTGCQLEIGDDASTFEFEPFETTQRKCQRYFYMMGGEAVYERFGTGLVRSSTQTFMTIICPTRMRSAPTVSLNSNGNFRIEDSAGHTVTGLSMDLPSSYAPHCIVSSSGMVQGRGAQLLANATTNARLSVSAEL